MSSMSLARPRRLSRLPGALSRGEWLAVAGMTLGVLLLHVVGFVTLLAIVAPHHFHLPGSTGHKPVIYGAGLGLTAYTLGMRHAFDADHIAAIDNTTRKLMADGKRPVSVGFWFSIGHSTIVFVLCLLLSVGVRALVGEVSSDDSALHSVTGVVGTAVSGGFLYLIAALNLAVLVGIVRVFREMRSGAFDEATLEQQLDSRGLMNRYLGRLTRSVTKSRQMYAVGVLFGLGFDTATEVSLLVVASGAAAFALPWYAILCLPVLFAAGMSLLDAADGCFMNFAYGWAFSKPVRKVYYNITVTALSVGVALIIGTIELVSILVDQFDVRSGPFAWLGGLDLNHVGYVIVGLFVGTWLIAVAVWRYARIEEKWSAGLRPGID